MCPPDPHWCTEHLAPAHGSCQGKFKSTLWEIAPKWKRRHIVVRLLGQRSVTLTIVREQRAQRRNASALDACRMIEMAENNRHAGGAVTAIMNHEGPPVHADATTRRRRAAKPSPTNRADSPGDASLGAVFR